MPNSSHNVVSTGQLVSSASGIAPRIFGLWLSQRTATQLDLHRGLSYLQGGEYEWHDPNNSKHHEIEIPCKNPLVTGFVRSVHCRPWTYESCHYSLNSNWLTQFDLKMLEGPHRYSCLFFAGILWRQRHCVLPWSEEAMELCKLHPRSMILFLFAWHVGKIRQALAIAVARQFLRVDGLFFHGNLIRLSVEMCASPIKFLLGSWEAMELEFSWILWQGGLFCVAASAATCVLNGCFAGGTSVLANLYTE